MTITESAKEFFFNLHDVECNQKYGKLPYSFHLELVEQQYFKFKHLIPDVKARPLNSFDTTRLRDLVLIAIYGHDSIEDCRLTYNDVNRLYGDIVAEIIYLCTEDKGRNRGERKSEKWYNELKTFNLAVFVKLCDLIANVKYSLLTNSTMFDKYKNEYKEKVKPILYSDEYKEMFDYLDKLFEF
jgi:hypothetical protein